MFSSDTYTNGSKENVKLLFLVTFDLGES